MPICEYKCTNCGYRFAMVEMLGTPRGGRECPICGSKETNRIICNDNSTKIADTDSGCKQGGG